MSFALSGGGQYVQQGEVIAKVKVIPDMGQLSSAEARVRLAEINQQQAQIDYERQKKLYDKQLVSADEFEKIRQKLRQTKEEIVAAQDALQVVRDGVSKSNASASSTLVRSTISGVILDVPVKVGNSVILSNTFNDGTTIASVANMNDLIFRGNIDETEVGQLVQGMPMKITIGALQDLKFDAALEYISGTKVLLMDEPTNGLDIPSKSQFRKVIAQHMTEDRTLIISTHQVHDVESLLDHILILSPQKLLLNASVAEIQEKYTFEYRTPDQMQDVLYAEPSLQGNAVVAPRKAGSPETQVNLELLFNAVNEGKI